MDRNSVIRKLDSMRIFQSDIGDYVKDKSTSEPVPSRMTGSSVQELLSKTMEFSIFDLANSRRIQALIGSSLQPAIPTILSSGARPTSWLTTVPPFATDPTPGYPSNAGYFGQQQDSVVPIPGPMLADALSYMRAVSDTQKMVYSQTPRLEGHAAVSLPLTADPVVMANPVPAGYSFVNNSDLVLGDTFTWDPLALAQLYAVDNTAFNAAIGANSLVTVPYQTNFKGTSAWLDAGIPPKRSITSLSYPLGSTLGFNQTLAMASVATSGTAGTLITNLAEALRQLVTSPVIQITGTPRPASTNFLAGGFISTLNQFFSIGGAASSAGVGSVSFQIYVTATISGVSYLYPQLRFRVNFTKSESTSAVRFLVPRGVTVSNVFQPGFAIPAAQLAPIKPGSLTALNVVIDANVSGAAMGMEWNIALANPSSLLLKQLLL